MQTSKGQPSATGNSSDGSSSSSIIDITLGYWDFCYQGSLLLLIFFSEDFAQFASNFRWRIQARDSRAQRLPLNESRLRTRRFRGRHIPYTQLWDRVPPVASRPDSLLADIADFAPRPGPSADGNSPIVIEDEVKSSWALFTVDRYM